MKIYAIGLLFFALETIIVIFYYSIADTKTPILIGILGVIINIALTYLLTASIGFLGIAIALVASKTIKCIWLFLILQKRQYINLSFLSSFMVKAVAGTLGFGLVVYGMGSFIEWTEFQTLIRLSVLAGLALLGGLVYLGIIRATRLHKEIPYS